MILPDANLLIYAHDASAPAHAKARAWWEAVLSNTEPVGVPWVVLLAFTRLMTHPQICREPLSVEETRKVVELWLGCPQVGILQVPDRAAPAFFDLLAEAGMGGNLTTDALIALHAKEHAATIYSNDRDFDRFRGIKRVNPLE